MACLGGSTLARRKPRISQSLRFPSSSHKAIPIIESNRRTEPSSRAFLFLLKLIEGNLVVEVGELGMDVLVVVTPIDNELAAKKWLVLRSWRGLGAVIFIELRYVVCLAGAPSSVRSFSLLIILVRSYFIM